MAGRQSKRPVNPLVDVLIGGRVRERRVQLGMSQKELAKEIGVAYQQLQKYEHGQDRIAFSRMLRVAEALDVDLNYFIGAGRSKKKFERKMTKDCLQLVRAYSAIRDPKRKRRVLRMVKVLANDT